MSDKYSGANPLSVLNTDKRILKSILDNKEDGAIDQVQPHALSSPGLTSCTGGTPRRPGRGHRRTPTYTGTPCRWWGGRAGPPPGLGGGHKHTHSLGSRIFEVSLIHNRLSLTITLSAVVFGLP